MALRGTDENLNMSSKGIFYILVYLSAPKC